MRIQVCNHVSLCTSLSLLQQLLGNLDGPRKALFLLLTRLHGTTPGSARAPLWPTIHPLEPIRVSPEDRCILPIDVFAAWWLLGREALQDGTQLFYELLVRVF